MIEKMEKVYIYSLKDQTKAVIEDILRCGILQLVQGKSMFPESIGKVLNSDVDRELSSEKQRLNRIDRALSDLKRFGQKKSIFHKKPELSYEELIDDSRTDESISVCENIEDIGADIRFLNKNIQDTIFRETSMLPWESFDLPLENMETGQTRILLYILPGKTAADIYEEAHHNDIPIYAEQVHEDRGYHYIALMSHEKYEDQLRELSEHVGAREFSTENMRGTFAENISLCRMEAESAVRELHEKESLIQELASKRETLEIASDSLKVKIQSLSGKEKLQETETVNVIMGWIPTSAKHRLNRKLESRKCFCQYEVPGPDEEYPVLIRNSKPVKPFGAITEMYSLPDSRSIDTNWAIGLFFFIFFGMMLSDAGYGAALLIGGFAGAKFIDIGAGGKRLFQMIGICGISTMFWGMIYGSWFGDVIPVAAKTFFGKQIDVPMLINPLNQPMTVLILACLLGVVHLFTGMGIKAYIMIKRGDKWGVLFDVGFWYMLLIGLPLLMASGAWHTAGVVLAVLGAAGLVFTQGRHKKSLPGKMISGVMSLYNITGYFSDVLSYSRILALGLATGVVASVVNIMATMAGGGITGAILFTVIFTAGHILNLGINALGAYVHSARLQYVEFFGKYYESGGEKFDPLRIKTKYVKVTEEK